jgi:hypothetical protein
MGLNTLNPKSAAHAGERIAADIAAEPLHSAVFAANINFFTRSCPHLWFDSHGSGEFVDREGEEKAPPATAGKPAKNESGAP